MGLLASATEKVEGAGGFGFLLLIRGKPVRDDVLEYLPSLSARTLPHGVELGDESFVDLAVELSPVVPCSRASKRRHTDINNTLVVRRRGFPALSACWNISRV